MTSWMLLRGATSRNVVRSHLCSYVAVKTDEPPVQRSLWMILCRLSAGANQTLNWTSTWYEKFYFVYDVDENVFFQIQGVIGQGWCSYWSPKFWDEIKMISGHRLISFFLIWQGWRMNYWGWSGSHVSKTFFPNCYSFIYCLWYYSFSSRKMTTVFSARFKTFMTKNRKISGPYTLLYWWTSTIHDESRGHWVSLHFQRHTVSPRRPSWSWSVVCVPASINCKQQMTFIDYSIDFFFWIDLLFWTRHCFCGWFQLHQQEAQASSMMIQF